MVRNEIRRLAIVNRGEAAMRCVRTVKVMRASGDSDIVAIALFTDVDRDAPFVRFADEAVELPVRATPVAAYLDHDLVIEALRAARADAVWPGWGFVAESASFVDRLSGEGIAFVGPSADTMRRLGDKIASKFLAESVGVPVTAWSRGALADSESAKRAAREIGLPLIVKASAGGGGRGIRVVREASQLEAAIASAQSEARMAFGDDRVFIEQLVDRGRHIEVQIVGDRHGSVAVLGCRDCSVQRRHQKLIEEAPPVGLSEALVANLKEAARVLAREVGYVGAGTVEFLVQDEAFYFLEMNPRLQVEHGITEVTTNTDIVEMQIRAARGERIRADGYESAGYAIEARVCAEDPDAGFLPSPGLVACFDVAAGPGIRIDTGVAAGTTVPGAFDSLIAKVIATGATREAARARLECALRDFDLVIEGGATNKAYLLDLLAAEGYRAGGVDTGWLDQWNKERRASRPLASEALALAAVLSYRALERELARSFFRDTTSISLEVVPPSIGRELDLTVGGQPRRAHVFATGATEYRVEVGARAWRVDFVETAARRGRLTIGGRALPVVYDVMPTEVRLEILGSTHKFGRQSAGVIRAGVPCLVVAVNVKVGDEVESGQGLGLLEAMKTEIAFATPVAGVVTEVRTQKGALAAADAVLVVIEPRSQSGESNASSSAEEASTGEVDPVAVLFAREDDGALGPVDVEGAAGAPAPVRARAVAAVYDEVRRALLGFDVSAARFQRLTEFIDASLPSPLRGDAHDEAIVMSALLRAFVDVERLFDRTPLGGRLASSHASFYDFVRRLGEPAGAVEPLAERLDVALGHYGLTREGALQSLESVVLRLLATRLATGPRQAVAAALLRRLAARAPELEEHAARSLGRLAVEVAAVPQSSQALVDGALAASFVLRDARRVSRLRSRIGLGAPLGRGALAVDHHGLHPEVASRLGLERLADFELERLAGAEGIYCFAGRHRAAKDDERLFVLVDVFAPPAPREGAARNAGALVRAAVLEAAYVLRSRRSERDPLGKLQWNRLVVSVRPEVAARPLSILRIARQLLPMVNGLGLEKAVVRLLLSERGTKDGRAVELTVSDGGGGRMEFGWREPRHTPLEPISAFDRNVLASRRRGLVYARDVVRMLTRRRDQAVFPSAVPEARPLPLGHFEEYELDLQASAPRAVLVRDRTSGKNASGIVFGVISTPTDKVREGMKRVLVLSDHTMGMGSLTSAECDRVCVAIDLAEKLAIPVEWVAVSAGARIAMDSGTENLDATARVVRRIVTFSQAGGTIHVIVPGINVGAQSYWNALATMLMHTSGALVMTHAASMVLTGRAALVASGSVSAEDEVAIGGYERIMGPNGQAHYEAADLRAAYRVLYDHYRYTYVVPGERGPRRLPTTDPVDRDVTAYRYLGEEASPFRRVGEIFSDETNPGRKRPFSMRALLRAVIDQDGGYLERWPSLAGGETAIVWDAHVGGYPVCLVGIESQNVRRSDRRPADGPAEWNGGTLFPQSSKKVARAINAASDNRPVVFLANLSGFDGSPESMRKLQLEYGAEIARAVVNFRGPIVFLVVSRYHGGAYVVFSRQLNPALRSLAVQGAYASVIGGAPAATVVFVREVEARTARDARVGARAKNPPPRTAQERAARDRLIEEVRIEKRAEVAREFDAAHSVERALKVGSLEGIVPADQIRPRIVAEIAAGLASLGSKPARASEAE